MTEIERKRLRQLLKRSPRTIWAYVFFIVPAIIVVVGTAVQVALLRYFEHQVPNLEVYFRHGKEVEVIWDSQMVKEFVLTTSLCITVTFGLLALLARQAFAQVRLLRAAAKDLGIDEGQQPDEPNADTTPRRLS